MLYVEHPWGGGGSCPISISGIEVCFTLLFVCVLHSLYVCLEGHSAPHPTLHGAVHGGRPTLEAAEEVAWRGCGMGCATGGGRHAIGVPPLSGGSTLCISSVSNIMKWVPPLQCGGHNFSIVYPLLSIPLPLLSMCCSLLCKGVEFEPQNKNHFFDQLT